MTIQEAAYEILKEKGHYLTSREIAKIALDRGMVKKSRAKDPIYSLAQTIDKNIRGEVYNIPKLCFARDERGRRVIGLPEWVGKENAVSRPPRTKTIEISAEVADMLELARLAGLGDNETKVADLLIRAGFKTVKSEIEIKLVNKVKQA